MRAAGAGVAPGGPSPGAGGAGGGGGGGGGPGGEGGRGGGGGGRGGGGGPPYPVRRKSFVPWRLPSSSAGAGRTPSGRLVAVAGTPYSTQWTQVPAGASGASHTRAKPLVPGGGAGPAEPGGRASPAPVCLR